MSEMINSKIAYCFFKNSFKLLMINVLAVSTLCTYLYGADSGVHRIFFQGGGGL